MVSTFEDLVEALAAQVKGGPLSDDEKVDLIDTVEDNGLDDPEALPPWLASLFDALVNHQAVPSAPQNAGAKAGGSAHNFLYELSELLDLDWDEHGEYFVLRVPATGMEAVVSVEDDSFRVQPIVS
jgi:hypothetical protein